MSLGRQHCPLCKFRLESRIYEENYQILFFKLAIPDKDQCWAKDLMKRERRGIDSAIGLELRESASDRNISPLSGRQCHPVCLHCILAGWMFAKGRKQLHSANDVTCFCTAGDQIKDVRPTECDKSKKNNNNTTTTEKCEAPNTQTMAVSSQATTKPVNCFLKLEWEHWILFLKTEGFLPLKHIYIFIDRDTVKRCRRERDWMTYSTAKGLRWIITQATVVRTQQDMTCGTCSSR